MKLLQDIEKPADWNILGDQKLVGKKLVEDADPSKHFKDREMAKA